MKRPFADQRIIGPLTDKISLSSSASSNSYNYSSRKCDVQYCFNGMSKKEALKDILGVYEHVHDVAPQRYDEIGVDVDKVTIVGSVTTGNFGCRDLAKIDKVVQEEIKTFFRGRPADEAQELVDKANSTLDLRDMIQEEKEHVRDPEVEEALFMLEDSLCSDVDMFMPADVSQDVLMDLQRDREFIQVQDQIRVEANKMSSLNMIFEPGIRAKETFEQQSGDVIESPKELKQIINKFSS